MKNIFSIPCFRLQSDGITPFRHKKIENAILPVSAPHVKRLSRVFFKVAVSAPLKSNCCRFGTQTCRFGTNQDYKYKYTNLAVSAQNKIINTNAQIWPFRHKMFIRRIIIINIRKTLLKITSYHRCRFISAIWFKTKIVHGGRYQMADINQSIVISPKLAILKYLEI